MGNNSKRAHKPVTFYQSNDLVFVMIDGEEFGRYILGCRYRYFKRVQGNNASNCNRDIQVDNLQLKEMIDRKIAVRQITKMRESKNVN